MCRGDRPAHGSPHTGNQHSRKTPESSGKLGVDPRGATFSNVQHHRTGREEPGPPGSNPPAEPFRQNPAGSPTPPEPRGRPPPPRRYRAPALAGESQCACRCVVLPDEFNAQFRGDTPESQCTYRCVVLPDTRPGGSGTSGLRCLNAPTGAWCSLTRFFIARKEDGMPSQCTYRCVVLPDDSWRHRHSALGRLNAPTGAWCSLTARVTSVWAARAAVSMHLQVRGAP